MPVAMANTTETPTTVGDNATSDTQSPTVIDPSSVTQPPSCEMPGNESLTDFLTRTVSNDVSILTPGTPQNAAFRSLTTNFPELSLPDDEDSIKEIYGLQSLYFSTNGPSWSSGEGWNTSNPVCGLFGLSEAWFGVLCNGNSSVISLDLQQNSLVGSLPLEISVLTSIGKSCMKCDYIVSQSYQRL